MNWGGSFSWVVKSFALEHFSVGVHRFFRASRRVMVTTALEGQGASPRRA